MTEGNYPMPEAVAFCKAEIDKLEIRVGAIENTLARQDEREKRIEHDTKNIRQMFNTLEARHESRHEAINLKIDSKIDGVELRIDSKIDGVQTKIDAKLDGLGKGLLGMGLSIIGTLFLLMITIIGYFLMQKDEALESKVDRRTQIEALSEDVRRLPQLPQSQPQEKAK